MDEASITRYVTDTFEGVDVVVASRANGAPEAAWGDTFFIHDPDRTLPPERRFPFATIVTKDYGDFDCASNLNRPGVFRLNLGIGRETYRSLFGQQETAVASLDEVGSDVSYDFTALDKIMPHPVYGKMHWVCVLNPSDATFEKSVRPLLVEAYELAVKRYDKAATVK